MDARTILNKYYSRLTKESIIKSLLLGLVAGFAMLLLSATIWWFVGLKFAWICGLIFVLSTAVATVIFYHKLYRPTIKKTASRVDALGLEERILTMAEYENENSFIALKQREDATNALKTVNERLLKLIVSVSAVAVLAVVSVFGLGMATVATLQEYGVIRSGIELLHDITTPAPEEFRIIYEVQGMGVVEGDSFTLSTQEKKVNGVDVVEVFQTVTQGSDAKPVIAVADDDWVFVGWSDGQANPYKIDKRPNKNITIVAVFEMITDVDNSEREGEADEAGIYEGDTTNPSNPSTGEPGDGNTEGGTYENINQILNNDTYYGDYFDSYLEDAMTNIAENGGTGEQVSVIDDYFKIIER